MVKFLTTLGTSGAKLVDLSIHIHMLNRSDELCRQYQSTLPPLHMLDICLVGDHPIMGGLLSLMAVKKLCIELVDEARFDPGFTDALKAAFMKDGTADGRSVSIEKGCTFPHYELDEEGDEEGPRCPRCGNTLKDLDNETTDWEYKDDMLS